MESGNLRADLKPWRWALVSLNLLHDSQGLGRFWDSLRHRLYANLLYLPPPSALCTVSKGCTPSCSSRVQLCDPMGYSLPGSSVHGILQERILEWVAISSSGGSSWPRDRTQVSHIAGWFFTSWATREAQEYGMGSLSLLQQILLIQESNQVLLYCRQLPFPFPGDLPNPGIKPVTPALIGRFFTTEPPR